MLPPKEEEQHENKGELQGGDLRPLADKLQRWRLAGLVAELLESGSAFAALAAQGLYIGQPLMETWIPKAQIRRLASMLEDPQGSAEFVRALRETSQ